jgi:sulfur-carrier protein adenylyltransferase/sulfurtransferase
MPNTIHIPTPLRPFTDKQESVDVSGGTVGELLADLTKKYEGLRKHLYAEDGRLRNFVNIYLNDEDIRYLQREKTPVKPGDSLSIVPSVAGGAPTTPADRVGAGLQTRPEASAADLTADEIKRYSRHLIMPEVGVDGQKRLKAGSVLPRVSDASASSTSTSSTSVICSASCCMERRTWGARSLRRQRIACAT